MKKFIFMIMVCCCFISRASTIEKSHAQNISASAVYFDDGSIQWGVSSDATLASPSVNLATSQTAVKDYVASVIPAVATIHNNVSRTLNSSYTISSGSTGLCYFTYSIQVAVTILGTGTITPQYSTNGGTTWISLPPVSSSSLLTTQILQVNGTVPAGALTRISTATVLGVSYTYQTGQEIY